MSIDSVVVQTQSEWTKEEELTMALLVATTSKSTKKRKHFTNLAKQIAESLPQEKVEEIKRELLDASWKVCQDQAVKERQRIIEQIWEVTGHEH